MNASGERAKGTSPGRESGKNCHEKGDFCHERPAGGLLAACSGFYIGKFFIAENGGLGGSFWRVGGLWLVLGLAWGGCLCCQSQWGG